MKSKTWWGDKFIEALVSFIDESRLMRGRAYRTPLRISNYLQKSNVISATMRGNVNPYFGVHETPYYKTKIEFAKIKALKELLHNITQDPLVLAKLITRELPLRISDILPKSQKDIKTSCSCPDWENPCKHIAGLYFKVAEEIDINPLLIFELRGVNKEAILDSIKELDKSIKVNTKKVKSKKIPKQMNLKNFWGVSKKIPEPSNNKTIPCILIKKAGINPPFWNKKKPFIEVADNLYKSIKREWKRV